MKKEFVEIYQRIYDCDTYDDGEKKPKKLLGKFEIIEIIYEDWYTSQKIGRMFGTQNLFLITEKEIRGKNGGSIYDIKPLKNLTIKNSMEKVL